MNRGFACRCCGICMCRDCMRRPACVSTFSPASPEQGLEYARHVLRHIAPLLAEEEALKVAEVRLLLITPLPFPCACSELVSSEKVTGVYSIQYTVKLLMVHGVS